MMLPPVSGAHLQGASRFAPSTTGPAHPGTLLAALLCWLDARASGLRLILRLEDLDPERCRPAYAADLVRDLAWLGLAWDVVEHQSAHHARHAAALDALAAAGRLYPCTASRKDLSGGRRAPDGGWAYDNRGRGTPLPAGGWRACPFPVRLRLDDGPEAPCDDGGLSLAGVPATAFGDPVVRRRDGAVAYHVACVVDDHASQVERVVRGRDIAPSTMVQAGIQRVLGIPAPRYRHHLLVLDGERKHSKFHGAVGAAVLRAHYRPEELCGLLAAVAGLRPEATPCTPADLLQDFTWDRVATTDVLLTWDGSCLRRAGA